MLYGPTAKFFAGAAAQFRTFNVLISDTVPESIQITKVTDKCSLEFDR